MKRVYTIIIAALCMIMMPLFAFAASLPEVAASIGRDLDFQLAERLGQDTPVQDQSLIMTVPADLDNLESTNTLARQMAEDLAAWFVQNGYRLQEIRKGKEVVFHRDSETMLTRKTNQLSNKTVESSLILLGTYVKTRAHVRFNLRLVHAPTNEVLAMTSRSINMSPEIAELLFEQGAASASAVPSVSTRINRPAAGAPYQISSAGVNPGQMGMQRAPVIPKSASPVYIPPVPGF